MDQLDRLKSLANCIVNDLAAKFDPTEVYTILSLAQSISLVNNITVEVSYEDEQN